MRIILTILGVSIAQLIALAWWLGEWQGTITARVMAMEEEHVMGRVLSERIITLEQKDIAHRDILLRIENRLLRIENKLDAGAR